MIDTLAQNVDFSVLNEKVISSYKNIESKISEYEQLKENLNDIDEKIFSYKDTINELKEIQSLGIISQLDAAQFKYILPIVIAFEIFLVSGSTDYLYSTLLPPLFGDSMEWQTLINDVIGKILKVLFPIGLVYLEMYLNLSKMRASIRKRQFRAQKLHETNSISQLRNPNEAVIKTHFIAFIFFFIPTSFAIAYLISSESDTLTQSTGIPIFSIIAVIGGIALSITTHLILLYSDGAASFYLTLSIKRIQRGYKSQRKTLLAQRHKLNLLSVDITKAYNEYMYSREELIESTSGSYIHSILPSTLEVLHDIGITAGD